MECSNRKGEMLNFTQHCDKNEGFYAHSLGDVNAERQGIVRKFSATVTSNKAKIHSLDANHSIYGFFLLVHNP